MKPLIWYIHGAGASLLSFTWLSENLLCHDAQFISYKMEDNLLDVVETVAASAALADRPVVVIGHSLGGLIAAGLRGRANIEKIISISAPLGGLALASVLSMISPEPMLRDLRPYGQPIRTIREHHAKQTLPHLAIVTTAGGLTGIDANDGVVSVDKQVAFKGPDYRYIELNHFEVLMSRHAADLITKFIQGTES